MDRRPRPKKEAFTILEIIIVIIIVGVLAGLALPRYFSLIENSRSTEAMIALGALRKEIENCAAATSGDYNKCTPNQLAFDPFAAPGAHFGLSQSQMRPDGAYLLIAERNTYEITGGDPGGTGSYSCAGMSLPVPAGSSIAMCNDLDTNTIWFKGSGFYKTLK